MDSEKGKLSFYMKIWVVLCFWKCKILILYGGFINFSFIPFLYATLSPDTMSIKNVPENAIVK